MFNRITKCSIYLLVFLLPLFFLPFSFEAFEFNKQYLLFFLVSIGFFSWIAKMVLVDKEIRFKRSPLDIFILAFLFTAILSAIFSVDKSSSLFGFYGRFSDGLIGLLSLVIMYFLITNNVFLSGEPSINADKKSAKISQKSASILSVNSLIRTLMWSVFFVILTSYLSILGVWAKFANLQFSIANFQFKIPLVMQQWTFNPAAGSFEGLAVFLAIIIILLTGYLIKGGKKEFNNVFLWILFLTSLILLIIVDFTPAWLVILVSLALSLVIVLWKRIFKEDVNKLLLPMFLMILGGIFLFVNTSGFQTAIFKFQLPKEQTLSQGLSWEVGLKGAVENVKSGFLGSGIGTWHYDFSKLKPLSFNQGLLWQIRFDRAGSYISELLGTTGFLGILFYLVLMGLTLMISYLFLQQNRSGIPLLMVFLALIISQFVYYQNTILAFVFWLILGFSVVIWQKPVKEKTITFKDFPELSLVFSSLLIVLGLGFLGTYFFAAKFYLADIHYKNAWGENLTQNLEKAVNLNPYQPQYKIVLARDYLSKVTAETQKPQDQIDQTALSLNVYLAITYGKGGQIGGTNVKGATELAPNRVAAWETLGMIYRDIQGVVTGVLEWGIKSFEKAISLEPANPVLHTELGKLYLVSDDAEKAKAEFMKAIELKPDYTDALIQTALIYERENNTEEAIRQMGSLANADPFNPEVLFQLGRLYFNNNQIDEAITQFERVIILMPNHSNAHYSLGVAYQKKGEKTKALQEFEKVQELNPGNADVQEKIKSLK